MKRIYLTSLLILFSIILYTQGRYGSDYIKIIRSDSIISNSSQEEVVYTPFGSAFKSNVHFVDKDHHLIQKNGNIELIRSKTGMTEQIYDTRLKATNLITQDNNTLFQDWDSDEGWITYAECEVFVSDPKPTYFGAEWVVPLPPLKKSDQLIYLFIGLGGAHILPDSNSITYILQPVLQWGMSPAGGGEYWAICNWLVTSEGLYFHDSLIKVNSGDRLQGIVKLIANSDSTYSYNSSFIEYGEGLDVYNINHLDRGYLALEAYNIKDCDEYPSDEKLRMFNIQMIMDDVYPPVFWHIYNNIDNCGEFINLINESSDNGEINIHFHKPFSEDNYEDIYIYPNPVGNIIHFSITDPVYNCRIEVYNNLGNLLLTENYKTLEYEYSLNIKNYAPGIYYVKIYYQKDKISWETNHTFKFIKTNR